MKSILLTLTFLFTAHFCTKAQADITIDLNRDTANYISSTKYWKHFGLVASIINNAEITAIQYGKRKQYTAAFNRNRKHRFVYMRGTLKISDCRLLNTNLGKIHFSEGMLLERCTFLDTLYLYDIYLGKNAAIKTSGNNYLNYVNLTKSHLTGHSIFYKDTYNENLNISDAEIDKLQINNSIIKKKLSLLNSTIKYKLDFSNSTLGTALDCNGLKIEDSAKITFTNTALPDTIILANISHISNEIDFSVANFQAESRVKKRTKIERRRPPRGLSDVDTPRYRYTYKKIYINIYKTDISKLHLDYSHFSLLTNNPDTNGELPVDEVLSIYEALLKNFKDRGQMISYKELDIEYNDYKWNTSSFSWLPILPKHWNNHGYEKEKVFKWTILFLFICTFITYFKYEILTNDVYKIDSLPSKVPIINYDAGAYFYKQVRKRFWYSFIYTASIFFLITLKVDKIKYHKTGAVIYLFLVYITGIICLAYIANLILEQ